jgi:hypothetical protein
LLDNEAQKPAWTFRSSKCVAGEEFVQLRADRLRRGLRRPIWAGENRPVLFPGGSLHSLIWMIRVGERFGSFLRRRARRRPQKAGETACVRVSSWPARCPSTGVLSVCGRPGRFRLEPAPNLWRFFFGQLSVAADEADHPGPRVRRALDGIGFLTRPCG